MGEPIVVVNGPSDIIVVENDIPITSVIAEAKQNVVVVEENAPVVAVVNIGTQGPKGEKGSSGDLHYAYTQGSAESTWEIEHNLGKYPSVSAEDSAGEDLEGTVEYINENKLKIIYSSATGGKAYLN